MMTRSGVRLSKVPLSTEAVKGVDWRLAELRTPCKKFLATPLCRRHCSPALSFWKFLKRPALAQLTFKWLLQGRITWFYRTHWVFFVNIL